jgi:hypothetical protein
LFEVSTLVRKGYFVFFFLFIKDIFIPFPANKKLINIRGNLLKELKKSQPNYESARELIGQFFHIMQMFYSNTNFIDDIGQNMYPAIGRC